MEERSLHIRDLLCICFFFLFFKNVKKVIPIKKMVLEPLGLIGIGRVGAALYVASYSKP